MLAACGCPGVTTIVGAAREPEIVDLARFLAAMGADIAGAGESTIVIRGGKALFPARYTVMGDRIAGATYLCAAAAAGGEIEVTGVQGGAPVRPAVHIGGGRVHRLRRPGAHLPAVRRTAGGGQPCAHRALSRLPHGLPSPCSWPLWRGGAAVPSLWRICLRAATAM